MKAVVLEKYGSPEALQLKEVSKPKPKWNQVLVKVHAVSINDWDWGILTATPFANRWMAGIFIPSKIPILGCDIAGRIEAVGANVKRFKVGDDVFGDLSSNGWGGFAEYLCADENALTLKPEDMPFDDAACLPQAGLLALQGLLQGKIDSGKHKKVLINGASGGAGTLAIQIAKSYGAEVTAVCSAEKMDLVKSLGADRLIDYKQQDFTRDTDLYDLILDVKGFHSLFDYRRVLNSKGHYVMLGGSNTLALQTILIGPLVSMFSDRKLGLLILKPNKNLEMLTQLYEDGKVRPVIDKRYPLEQASEAMRYYAHGLARGKVVISMES
ncbi:NAD(P)-dependent alcohol dehydrogenase [Thiomicrorhabdus sp.]|uniref:NAD(P)-dependent alcohol dehydrogenase n=1 Tax=Thiomicrorhabdus sp. TaxID=2039724 RepID=UPI003564B5D3